MRFHTSLPVKNIEQTVAFYRTLFGSEPVKQRDDYAKFLPEGLALNLTIHRAPEAVANLSALHLGLELLDRESLDGAHARLAAAGLIVQERETSVCCYANQDKFWVEDPDGYRWELYYLVNDADYRIDDASGCCAPTAAKADAAGSCCG